MLFSGPMTSSLGANLVYERNEYGELICFKANEAETNARFTSEHQYDSLGFELERLLPGGVSQSFAYDNIGRLIDSKPAAQRSSTDRRLSIENDRYGLTQYSYNPSGELTVSTYADGRKGQNLRWNIDGISGLYALYRLIDGTCQQDWRKISSTAQIAPL